MLEVFLDRLAESVNDLLRYIDGVDEFESVLGTKFINMLNVCSDEISWKIHELDFDK